MQLFFQNYTNSCLILNDKCIRNKDLSTMIEIKFYLNNSI